MPEALFTLGPVALHSYGLLIATGLLVALFFARRDPLRQKLCTDDQLYTIVTLAIASGIVGGKLFHLIAHWSEFSSWREMVASWNEGFWVLGSFVAAFITVGSYLYRAKLPVIRLFDRLTLYIPLMFAISRLGCFFTGCCYGAPTTLPWAVTSEGLHPTQLYSSAAEFFIFLLLYTTQKSFKRPGQLFSFYLLLMSLERFSIDFLRGDRTLITTTFSSPQLVAMGIAMISLLLCITATFTSLFDRSDRIRG